MFCQHCGAELRPETSFCVQCGVQLKSKYPNKTLLLAATLALCGLSIGVFTYLARQKSVNTVNSPAVVDSLPTSSPTFAPTPKPIVKPSVRIEPTQQTKPVERQSPTPSPSLKKAEPMLITTASFTLHARRYVSYIVKVGLNQRDVRLIGDIKVRGGDQDIWVGVLTEQEFENFVEGQPFGLVYGDNIVGSSQLNVPLSPAKHYRVVLSNQHAQFLSKHVYPRLMLWHTWAN